MKFLSLIFVFCISGLIIQPTLSVLLNNKPQQELCDNQCCSEDQSCDDKRCHEEQSNENGCCPGGICNPFESCACCCSLNITKPVIEVSSNDVIINYTQVEIEKVNFGHSSDCFHPPEIV